MADKEEKRKNIEREILKAKKIGESEKFKKNIPSKEDAQRIFRTSFNELSEMQKSVLKSTEKCFKICINDKDEFENSLKEFYFYFYFFKR